MSLPAAFLVIRLMVLDTFRQSLASRVFWLIAGLSGLCIVLCLSVRVEGATATKPEGELELFGGDKKPFTGQNHGEGYLKLAFGAIRIQLARDSVDAVSFLQALLIHLAASVGTLLLLLWTSAFLPEFLHRLSVPVLLVKPVPRWSLLAGKWLGVLWLVGLQITLFVGGTWLALALTTGVWNPAALFSIPLLLLLFTILYSFSALLAVWTRSAGVCVFGTLLFWALCASINVAYQAQVASQAGVETHEQNAFIDLGYWVLPKPADCVKLLGAVMHSDQHFRSITSGATAREGQNFLPELSVLTSLLFVATVLTLAGWQFVRQDY